MLSGSIVSLVDSVWVSCSGPAGEWVLSVSLMFSTLRAGLGVMLGLDLLALPKEFCGATYFTTMSDLFAKIALDFLAAQT